MSRLRRPFLYDRYIFVAVDLLSSCSAGLALKPCGLSSSWKSRNARRRALRYISLARTRQKQRLVLTAWLFLPDHWHGAPTIDRVHLPDR